MPQTVLRSDINDLLGLVITRLVARSVVPSENSVIVTATEDVPHFIAEQDVLLFPQDEQSGIEAAEAAGRYDTRSKARLWVIARSRLALDEAGRDRERLMHASLGHFLLRANIRDALQIYWPENSNRDLLALMPLHWIRTTAPKKDRTDAHWVSSIVEFEIVYSPDLDQSYQ